MTPFGDDGPWADFKSSDLIHLALGGVMMNCGYDPDPNLEYDTPPIAPQIWHAYHIAGEQLATGIIAALIHRETQRRGAGRLGGDPRGGVEEPRAGHHVLGHAAGAAVAADQPPCRRDPEPLAGHLSHQGRALVHVARHGCARPEEPGAAAVEIRRAGRSAAAAARCRSAGAPGARHGDWRRNAGAYARHRAALYPRLDLCRHAVARGAGCRASCGRRCASRTRTRSTSIG